MYNKTYLFIGVAVNFIWGTAFLIPYYLSDTNPVAIALGRYIVYGLISIFMILVTYKRRPSLSFAHWRHAFLLAFAGNVGYYICLTLAIHFNGITIAALIVGILPISTIIYGNYIEQQFKIRQLIVPIAFIFSGITWLNLSHVQTRITNNYYNLSTLGILFALMALILWTWYGVSNARFLKKNPNISNQSWTIAIGVGCFIQSVVGIPILLITTDGTFLTVGNPSNTNSLIFDLILGCIFLGVVVSWIATIWWNKVSRNIPVSIAGQLIVFETISSLIYGYIVDSSLPSMNEFFSACLIIFGVVLGIKSTSSTCQNSISLQLHQGDET